MNGYCTSNLGKMTTDLTIHTDGGARGNPGPSAIGVVIETPTQTLASFGLFIGIGTNNQAEYKAVRAAIAWIQDHAADAASLSFFLDSQLVVSQLTGKYRLKHPEMIRLKNEIDQQLRYLGIPATFQYVPRAQNAAADALVNQALDAAQNPPG